MTSPKQKLGLGGPIKPRESVDQEVLSGGVDDRRDDEDEGVASNVQDQPSATLKTAKSTATTPQSSPEDQPDDAALTWEEARAQDFENIDAYFDADGAKPRPQLLTTLEGGWTPYGESVRARERERDRARIREYLTDETGTVERPSLPTATEPVVDIQPVAQATGVGGDTPTPTTRTPAQLAQAYFWGKDRFREEDLAREYQAAGGDPALMTGKFISMLRRAQRSGRWASVNRKLLQEYLEGKIPEEKFGLVRKEKYNKPYEQTAQARLDRAAQARAESAAQETVKAETPSAPVGDDPGLLFDNTSADQVTTTQALKDRILEGMTTGATEVTVSAEERKYWPDALRQARADHAAQETAQAETPSVPVGDDPGLLFDNTSADQVTTTQALKDRILEGMTTGATEVTVSAEERKYWPDALRQARADHAAQETAQAETPSVPVGDDPGLLFDNTSADQVTATQALKDRILEGMTTGATEVTVSAEERTYWPDALRQARADQTEFKGDDSLLMGNAPEQDKAPEQDAEATVNALTARILAEMERGGDTPAGGQDPMEWSAGGGQFGYAPITVSADEEKHYKAAAAKARAIYALRQETDGSAGSEDYEQGIAYADTPAQSKATVTDDVATLGEPDDGKPATLQATVERGVDYDPYAVGHDPVSPSGQPVKKEPATIEADLTARILAAMRSGQTTVTASATEQRHFAAAEAEARKQYTVSLKTAKAAGSVEVGGETFDRPSRYVEVGGETFDQQSKEVAPPLTGRWVNPGEELAKAEEKVDRAVLYAPSDPVSGETPVKLTPEEWVAWSASRVGSPSTRDVPDAEDRSDEVLGRITRAKANQPFWDYQRRMEQLQPEAPSTTWNPPPWSETPSVPLSQRGQTDYSKKWMADYEQRKQFQRYQHVNRAAARLLENYPPPEGATTEEIRQHVQDIANRYKHPVTELRSPEHVAAANMDFNLLTLALPGTFGAAKTGVSLTKRGIQALTNRLTKRLPLHEPDATTLAMLQARREALGRMQTEVAKTPGSPDPAALRQVYKDTVSAAYQKALDDAGVLGRLKRDVNIRLKKFASGPDGSPEFTQSPALRSPEFTQSPALRTAPDASSDVFDPYLMRHQRVQQTTRQAEQAAQEALEREQAAELAKAKLFKERQQHTATDTDTVKDVTSFLDRPPKASSPSELDHLYGGGRPSGGPPPRRGPSDLEIRRQYDQVATKIKHAQEERARHTTATMLETEAPPLSLGERLGLLRLKHGPGAVDEQQAALDELGAQLQHQQSFTAVQRTQKLADEAAAQAQKADAAALRARAAQVGLDTEATSVPAGRVTFSQNPSISQQVAGVTRAAAPAVTTARAAQAMHSGLGDPTTPAGEPVITTEPVTAPTPEVVPERITTTTPEPVVPPVVSPEVATPTPQVAPERITTPTHEPVVPPVVTPEVATPTPQVAPERITTTTPEPVVPEVATPTPDVVPERITTTTPEPFVRPVVTPEVVTPTPQVVPERITTTTPEPFVRPVVTPEVVTPTPQVVPERITTTTPEPFVRPVVTPEVVTPTPQVVPERITTTTPEPFVRPVVTPEVTTPTPQVVPERITTTTPEPVVPPVVTPEVVTPTPQVVPERITTTTPEPFVRPVVTPEVVTPTPQVVPERITTTTPEPFVRPVVTPEVTTPTPQVVPERITTTTPEPVVPPVVTPEVATPTPQVVPERITREVVTAEPVVETEPVVKTETEPVIETAPPVVLTRRTDVPSPTGVRSNVPQARGGAVTDIPWDDTSPARESQAVPRPPGAYPRSIEHAEQIEYRYNPETGEFNARIVESSEPVVTGWDMSPPERDERPVGTWDVTPTDDGVVATNGQRVAIPEGVKAQLRAEAEETGEAISKTTTLRYRHDLDTRETQSGVNRLSTADMAEALRARNRQSQGGELDSRYQSMLDRMMRAQQQQQRGRSNRRASSRLKEKQAGYQLPQIVVVQESTPTRRVGGL